MFDVKKNLLLGVQRRGIFFFEQEEGEII